MKRLFLYSLIVSGFLFACNQAEQSGTEHAEETKQEAEKKAICLEFLYPVTYKMPDGSTITGNSKKEVSNAMKNWHAAHPDIQERGLIQFPVNARFKGSSVTIKNVQELRNYRLDCAESKEPCFTFIFPISYIMPDNTVITIKDADDEENKTAVSNWYDDNPDVKGRPLLKFPIDVTLRDGSKATLNSEEDMQEVRQACDQEKKQ